MTIDDAIETIHSFWAIPAKSPTLSQLEALKMGIEALKWVKTQRDMDIIGALKLLPGETDE